jgi:hypothetical protein
MDDAGRIPRTSGQQAERTGAEERENGGRGERGDERRVIKDWETTERRQRSEDNGAKTTERRQRSEDNGAEPTERKGKRSDERRAIKD